MLKINDTVKIISVGGREATGNVLGFVNDGTSEITLVVVDLEKDYRGYMTDGNGQRTYISVQVCHRDGLVKI